MENHEIISNPSLGSDVLTQRILVATKDAGGCNAVLPVAQRISQAGYQLLSLAEGPAIGLLERALLPAKEFGQLDGLSSLFDDFRPCLALVANSWGPSVEDQVVMECRIRGIPSVGLLDSWVLCTEKFGNSHNRWEYLPDYLVIADHQVQEEMLQAGAPKNRLVILGQPHFDSIDARNQSAPASTLDAVRKDLGVTRGQSLVILLSQAMDEFYGRLEAHRRLGYSEFDVLDDVRAAVDTLQATGLPLKLIVKLHPREQTDKYSDTGLICLRDISPHLIVRAADLVIGMDTMLLLEAALMGSICLSYQPNLRHPDTSGLSRYGLGESCYQPDQLQETISSLLFDERRRRAARQKVNQVNIGQGATQRIFDFVVSHLNHA